jgi:menaquinol-cytochrome c reductase iron-sulfur subunit
MSTETETHGTDTQVSNKETTMARLVDRSRRNFLLKLSLALNGIVGAALAVPILGYLFGPMKKDLPKGAWIGLGSLEKFPEGETRLATFRNPTTTPWDGQTGEVSCWVRRIAGEKFQVFAINCAHLGCPVRWFEESKLFMCPCHGGAYYQDGSRASGPPERGLFEYKYKVVNSTLSIDVHGLPTLATEARLNNPLVQIQGADGKKSGGCGCQG